MSRFPWSRHPIGVMTVERPGALLHRLLVRKGGFCVGANLGYWGELLYLSHEYRHLSDLHVKCNYSVMRGRFRSSNPFPPYAARDRC